jgi:hypothetical protein
MHLCSCLNINASRINTSIRWSAAAESSSQIMSEYPCIIGHSSAAKVNLYWWTKKDGVFCPPRRGQDKDSLAANKVTRQADWLLSIGILKRRYSSSVSEGASISAMNRLGFGSINCLTESNVAIDWRRKIHLKSRIICFPYLIVDSDSNEM